MRRAEGTLRIVGAETDDNTVRADILIDTLSSLQTLVLLAAAAKDGMPLRVRFKPSEELRRRHQLRCALPEAGSYSLAVLEEDEEDQAELSTYSALKDAYRFTDAVISGRHDQLHALVPEHSFRTRMLRTVGGMAPSEGDRWAVDFSAGGQPVKRLGYDVRSQVDRLIRVDQPPTEDEGSLIGEVVKVDFASRIVSLRHKGTNRTINCSYSPSVEDELLDSRRDLVQVIGRFELNAQGELVGVIDAISIEPVDLSPIELHQARVGNSVLRIQPALRLEPALDEESRQFFVVTENSLSLNLIAPTRQSLIQQLLDEIALLWREYGQAEDHALSPAAVRLKAAVRARFREEPNIAAP